MPAMNDAKSIQQQYVNADGLQTRMLLHRKYSTNRQPYGEWISDHYQIQPGMKVLELGCGTGSIWTEPSRWLPDDAALLLTDFSEGMLETARGNVPAQPNISFAQVDIQDIPYEDHTYDLIIANAMLYHVPDLDKGLSEVARVLKPGGRFICSTSGVNGVSSWLVNALGAGESPSIPFHLQNGGKILEKHFASVEMRMREDSLEVTDVNDLAAYVRSMISFSFVRDWPLYELLARLNAQAVDGIIHIPKEYGLFLCTNPKKQ